MEYADIPPGMWRDQRSGSSGQFIREGPSWDRFSTDYWLLMTVPWSGHVRRVGGGHPAVRHIGMTARRAHRVRLDQGPGAGIGHQCRNDRAIELVAAAHRAV